MASMFRINLLRLFFLLGSLSLFRTGLSSGKLVGSIAKVSTSTYTRETETVIISVTTKATTELTAFFSIQTTKLLHST